VDEKRLRAEIKSLAHRFGLAYRIGTDQGTTRRFNFVDFVAPIAAENTGIVIAMTGASIRKTQGRRQSMNKRAASRGEKRSPATR